METAPPEDWYLFEDDDDYGDFGPEPEVVESRLEYSASYVFEWVQRFFDYDICSGYEIHNVIESAYCQAGFTEKELRQVRLWIHSAFEFHQNEDLRQKVRDEFNSALSFQGVPVSLGEIREEFSGEDLPASVIEEIIRSEYPACLHDHIQNEIFRLKGLPEGNPERGRLSQLFTELERFSAAPPFLEVPEAQSYIARRLHEVAPEDEPQQFHLLVEMLAAACVHTMHRGEPSRLRGILRKFITGHGPRGDFELLANPVLDDFRVLISLAIVDRHDHDTLRIRDLVRAFVSVGAYLEARGTREHSDAIYEILEEQVELEKRRKAT